MIVRAATLADAAEVARIHVDAWRVAYAGIIPDLVLSSLSISEREAGWVRWLDASLVGKPTDGITGPSHRLIVAEADRGVVGWAAFGEGRDAASRDEGELAGLYVDPSAWGHGVGSALMDAVVEDLSGRTYASAILWVLGDNDRAIRFYETRGWLPDGGEKRVHVGGRADVLEIRLRRRLDIS